MKTPITRQAKNDVKNAIRSKYAWPGGYPLFILTNDGAALCVDCSKSEFRQIAQAWAVRMDSGWLAVASDVNWEDDSLYCDHCNKQIESAYGDDNN